MKKKVTEMTKEERVGGMIAKIEQAAIEYRLNITILDGKIGFVDQAERKIVAIWGPSYTLGEIKNRKS